MRQSRVLACREKVEAGREGKPGHPSAKRVRSFADEDAATAEQKDQEDGLKTKAPVGRLAPPLACGARFIVGKIDGW